MDLGLDPALRVRLQQRLEELIQPAGPSLGTVLTPILRRPAKRIRPALLLTVADSGGTLFRSGIVADALTCAAALELLHQSSLIHDDLMDDAPSRGNLPTVHHTHSSGLALVAGDYLVGAAGAALCDVDVEAARDGLRAYREMCRGQALETVSRHNVIDVERHLEILRGKTGALLRAACTLGARLADLGPQATTAYGEYGLSFGTLFQIVDDLLDLVSTPDLAGKPIGQDLPNGVYTLPVLLAARRYGDSFTRHLKPGDHELSAARARTMARRDVVLAEVLAYACQCATAAQDSLRDVPDSPVRTRLAALPFTFLERAVGMKVAPEHRRSLTALLPAAR
jgi:geranylgeranyl pyrophosphate synthase